MRSLVNPNSWGMCRRKYVLSAEEALCESESGPANAPERDSSDGKTRGLSEDEKSQQEAAGAACKALDTEGFSG